MRFYTGQHRFYCGIDLHVRTMYVCVLDAAGEVLLHQNLRRSPRRCSRPCLPIATTS